jgi:phosphoglycolate phosphatase
VNRYQLTCQAVLFDLDGTLVDSAPDLCAAMNHVLSARGATTLPLAQVRDYVGNGARYLLARGLFGRHAEPPEPNTDPAFELAVADFLQYYEKNIANTSRLYPGVPETLAVLKRTGFQLAVVTNKPERLTHLVLDALSLSDYFSYIWGARPNGGRKPDPEPLLETLAALHCVPAQAVMVGDASPDAGAAHAVGCPFIGVSYGYNQGQPITTLQPARVLNHFSQLSDMLTKGCTTYSVLNAV